MRGARQAGAMEVVETPFNSLFEMHLSLIAAGLALWASAFNSLFEMR